MHDSRIVGEVACEDARNTIPFGVSRGVICELSGKRTFVALTGTIPLPMIPRP